MTQYVAITEDGVVAIYCEEAVEAYGQYEFYGIEKIQYNIDLDVGRITVDNFNVDPDDSTWIMGKHPKFETGGLDVVPESDIDQAVIFWVFLW